MGKTSITKKKMGAAKKRVTSKAVVVAKQKKTLTKTVAVKTAKRHTVKIDVKALSRKDIKSGVLSDDMQFTHIITKGRYSGCVGYMTTKLTFAVLKNKRGKLLYRPQEIVLNFDDARELTHQEVMNVTNVLSGDDEGEDLELVEYEKLTWECPKCENMVKNDNGYCPKLIDGVVCCGAKAMPETGPTGWAGCFGTAKHPVYADDTVILCPSCSVKNALGAKACVVCEVPLVKAKSRSIAGGDNHGVKPTSVTKPFTFGSAVVAKSATGGVQPVTTTAFHFGGTVVAGSQTASSKFTFGNTTVATGIKSN